MSIFNINGKDREFKEKVPETVSQLLELLEIDQATVVAEIEGAIIAKKDFSEVRITPGQKIELIRFVGGG